MYSINSNIKAVSDDFNWSLEQLFLKSYQISDIKTHQMTTENYREKPLKLISKSGTYQFRDGKLECNGVVQEFTSPTYVQWLKLYQEIMNFILQN